MCALTPRQVFEVIKKAISAALFVLTLCLGLLSAAPSQAAASVTDISDGVVSGKGTVVTGTYTVTCDYYGERVYAYLDLRQRGSGKAITSSSFSDSFECEGNGVPVTRTYRFAGGSTAYKSGVATVTGTIQACTDFVGCKNEPVYEEISLVKK